MRSGPLAVETVGRGVCGCVGVCVGGCLSVFLKPRLWSSTVSLAGVMEMLEKLGPHFQETPCGHALYPNYSLTGTPFCLPGHSLCWDIGHCEQEVLESQGLCPVG